VSNQGECGDPTIFDSVNAIASIYKIQKGTLPSLSYLQVEQCNPNGCNGGPVNGIFEYAQKFGLELSSVYPSGPTCVYNASQVYVKISGTTTVT